MARMCDIAIREEILLPQAAYGYWRCAARGNEVILFDDSGPGEKSARSRISRSRARTRKVALHRRFLPRRR